MYKKVQLVMLPINEKAVIGFLTQKGKERGHLVHFNRPMPNILDSENQHLYFLSDEKIKEGDWCHDKVLNIVFQTDKNTDFKYINQTDNCKKIIATTDKSLKITEDLGEISIENILPQISESFIEYYVSEYNKGNIITEVMVEYSNDRNEKLIQVYPYSYSDLYQPKLKVNPDDTINIKPIKDSWNREEVENELMGFFTFMTYGKWKGSDFKKWNGSKSFRVVEEYIKENL